MVSVCLTCGSEGWPEWLVFCKKCQASALHRYCLDGPTKIHEDVTWFCDDCEPKEPPPLKNSPLPCRRSHNRKLGKGIIPVCLKLNDHLKRAKKNYQKRQKRMKMQKDLKGLDQPKVAITKCSSSSSYRDQNHSRRLDDNNHKEQKKLMKKHKETADISGHVSTRQESSPDLHISSHDRIQSSKPCDQTLCSAKEQNKFMEKHKEQRKFIKQQKEQRKFIKQQKEQKMHKEQEKFIMKQHKEVLSHYKSSSDCQTHNHNEIQCSELCDLAQFDDNFEDTSNSNMVPANFNKVFNSPQNSGTSLNKDLNAFKPDCKGVAQPVAQPIWRGSFFISNQGINGPVRGLAAHASTLACSKVWDETKLFPEVLCADLIDRSAVWPEGFKRLGPTRESIALYIFPETERYEKPFDKLVTRIIFLDLAIRMEVVNAEFVVFPSTVLPTPYKRYKTKYYLWGVFRSKQASTAN